MCEIDLRVGGNRYEWVDMGRGKTMSMGGVFPEVVKPELIGSKEKFDDDWMMGETVNTQVFTQKGGKTHMMLRSSTHRKKPAMAPRPGMTGGMEAGYARLDEVLASLG